MSESDGMHQYRHNGMSCICACSGVPVTVSGSIAPDVPVMAMAARALKYMYRVHVMYRELGGQSGRRAGQAKLTGQY